MKIVQTEVLIIGGGLTGLTIAYLLQKENIAVKVVEARDRLGGRIKTKGQKHRLFIQDIWMGRLLVRLKLVSK